MARLRTSLFAVFATFVVQLWAEEQFDYCVIGAGPAGLQMGYFLKTAGRNYMIFERSNITGSFFEQFPRHRVLISINKRFTGKTNREFNLRHDWNSLISDDDSLLFTKYSDQLFPHADEYLRYLDDYRRKLKLNVRFNTEISDIKKIRTSVDDRSKEVFIMTDQRRAVYHCNFTIVANGISKPNTLPSVRGWEYVELYDTMSIDPKDFEGQSVLILGHGNSAFETARALYGSTSIIHVAGRDRVRLSWSTHYVGDLRAVNNDLLDTYQLKSLDGILEGAMDGGELGLVKVGEGVAISQEKSEARHLKEQYNRVISCLGFKFDDALFSRELGFNFSKKHPGKYPAVDASYQSTNIKNLFFAGTNTHSVDHRKSAGGFIHGYRYTVQATHRYLEWRNHGVPWPSVTLPITELTNILMKRINEASGAYQMFTVLGDVFILDQSRRNFIFVEEFPIKMLHKLSRMTGYKATSVLVWNFEYGANFSGPGKDVFSNQRVGATTSPDAHKANFLHPVIYFYEKLPTLSDMSKHRKNALPRPDAIHYLVEDLNTSWGVETDRDVTPFSRFLENITGTDLRKSFDETCFTHALTTTSLPFDCTTHYMEGVGLSMNAFILPRTTSNSNHLFIK